VSVLTGFDFRVRIVAMVSVNLELFADCIAAICARTQCVPERPLQWTVIANPLAGGFTIRSRWRKHYAQLCASREKARAYPVHKNVSPSVITKQRGAKNGLMTTTGPGHAGSITRSLISMALPTDEPTYDGVFYLIITAGGDGTSREVASALSEAPPDFLHNCVLLSLPLGTGNDGADDGELDKALDLLILPSRIEYARSLQLRTATAGKGPFMAFNVLSVGLDAFVTHQTNKMKGKMPGDSYKLWVDLAALFYDKIYRVGPLTIATFNAEGKQVYAEEQRVLLMAVGVSGRRTYGSGIKILPDERNICIIRQMPLMHKILIKEKVSAGTHTKEKEVTLLNAERIEMSGLYPLLAQMDGETVLLKPQDFPASIELTEPLIPHLVPASGGYHGRQ
jgi:diacylglycerol kinase family enzyme